VLTSTQGAVISFDPTNGSQLVEFNPGFGGTSSSSALRNTSGLALDGTGPLLLTSHSTLVFSAYQGGVSDTLEEFDLAGTRRFECALPNGSWDYASASAGHWVAQRDSRTLESYAVSGLEPAPLGWMTSRGTPTQEGRPR
jgi:hypothetical protein